MFLRCLTIDWRLTDYEDPAMLHSRRLFPASITAAIALAISAAASPVYAGPGTWTTRGPHGGSVDGLTIYEPSPNTLWAFGRGGVFRSLSGGSSWSRIQVGLPDGLSPRDLVASTTAPVAYLTTYSRIYRSADAGSLWIPTALPAAVGHLSPFFVDLTLLRGTTNNIAVAAYNAAYVSTDGGSTWSAPGASGETTNFTKIEFADDGALYLGIQYSDPSAFGGAVLLKSTDAGITWAPTPGQPATGGIDHLATSPTDAQRIYASAGGAVATSADGGTTWTAINLPPATSSCDSFVTGIAPHPTIATALFVGCGYRGLIYSANITVAAPAWAMTGVAAGFTANGSDPAQANSFAIHPSYATTPTVWIGTEAGGLFKSTNAAATFAPSNNGYESTNIRALAPHPTDTDAGTTILAGYGDVFFTTSTPLYRSPDSGLSWLPSATTLNAEQIRAVTIDPTTVDDDPFTAENFTAYAAGLSGRIPMLANRDGGIYKSTDGGNSWTSIDNGIAVVGGTPHMGTVRNVVLDSRSCAAPPASGPCPIGSGPLQTVYVAGSGVTSFTVGVPNASAQIYKSTNAGASWTAAVNGLPLPQDLGPPGAGNVAYLALVVPLVIDPANPQTLYVGSLLGWQPDIMAAALPSIGNGVYKSTDGGTNWSLSSTGLPTVAGPGTSNWDVLALAIDPVNPQILYAGAINFSASVVAGRVFKTINGGATWSEASNGIAGADVRALLVDPADPTGNTVYAGTGGSSAGPGGVYRSRDAGATWNSISLDLPATAALALSLPNRGLGDPARLIAGTTAGVWEFTEVPDEDADGARTSIENLIGDGNGDSIPDAMQPEVASIQALPSTGINESPEGVASVKWTMTIVPSPGSCGQFNDATNRQASLYPPDPIGNATSLNPNGLISFTMPDCPAAKVHIKYNYAFDNDWHWRNYGPRIPGDDASFGWYSFPGVRRISIDTWELDIDASRQGNYRDDLNNILFVGGPSRLPDLIFDHGFE